MARTGLCACGELISPPACCRLSVRFGQAFAAGGCPVYLSVQVSESAQHYSAEVHGLQRLYLLAMEWRSGFSAHKQCSCPACGVPGEWRSVLTSCERSLAVFTLAFAG